MVGGGEAELDIFTDPEYRGKGLATSVALLLIDKLLEIGLTPTWSAWSFRVESLSVAKHIGFIPTEDVQAWVWVEEEQH